MPDALRARRLPLATPPGFRYRATVFSHGWCALAPFSYDEATAAITRVHRLASGAVVRFTVEPLDGETALAIDVAGPAADGADDEIRSVVARILSFDHNLSDFYALARAHPEYQWIERVGAGRMLVSPTVWEDLAKTLLTTNTTWSQTKGMVSRLVELGDAHPSGGHAFPTPQQVAALSPEALNQQVRAGYRGAYLHRLALDIAEGRLDPEAWRDPALPAAEVYRQLRALKGFGDYAAGAMMRLLARFDQLGLDSVCRTMFKTLWNQHVPASDREIAAHYERFGPWRGLAVWMDVMRDDLLPSDGGG